jgi:molecular chaperone GrpE
MHNLENTAEMETKETAAEEKEEISAETEAAAAESEDAAGKGKKADVKKLKAENKELSEKLAAAEADAAEQKDKYLRTLAEYDNYRKRTAKEREGIYADAAADCIGNLLPLLDNLERASHFTDGAQAADGVRMILASVPDILGKMNISSFGAPGETFDPNIHNAVMHIEDEQYGEGEIVEVFQCGYRRGDKILRYAMVKTAN